MLCHLGNSSCRGGDSGGDCHNYQAAKLQTIVHPLSAPHASRSCGQRGQAKSLKYYCRLHRTCPGKRKKLEVSCHERAVLVARQPEKEVLCLGMCDVICNRILIGFLVPSCQLPDLSRSLHQARGRTRSLYQLQWPHYMCVNTLRTLLERPGRSWPRSTRCGESCRATVAEQIEKASSRLPAPASVP